MLVEQEQLLELDVADVRTVGEDLLRRRQCHLAVGSPRQRGDIAHQVVAQPRQRDGADIALPGVPFRLLKEPHMSAQQRMCGDAVITAGTRRRGVPGEPVVAVGPHRQRSVHQPSGRIENREVHCRTGIVQVGDEVQ